MVKKNRKAEPGYRYLVSGLGYLILKCPICGHLPTIPSKWVLYRIVGNLRAGTRINRY